MKLTKFVHACVLAEDSEHTALFDPGNFAWDGSLANLETLPKLDFVLITHEHPDHYSEEFVREILKKFPDVNFYTNESIASKLSELGAKNINTQSDDKVQIESLEHASLEPLTPGPGVLNVAIHYKNKITTPGDSHELKQTKEILFLPVAAPWGASVNAAKMADKLKPKVIVPIHDWMWKNEWRSSMYDRYENYFNTQNIKFIKPINGQSFEI